MATFEELGLGEKVMAAINQMGYTEATPVQEQAIPLVLAGNDVIAAAQTGTGKTAAFTLPVLDKLGHYQKGHGPLALIVTPTRELAQQIDTVARTVGRKTGHYILTVVGGVSYNPQINGLRRGVDVLVATPGRLLDLYDRGALQLDDIQVLVLDEADRMLDMGFWPDVKQIIDALPAERQTLLFSATIDDSVMRTIGGEVKDPKFVEIAHKGTAAETVEQFIIPVSQGQKTELLEYVLDEKGSERVIVFTRTKARAEVLAERLNREGFSAEAIHGDRSQGQRSRALKMFREGRVGILVATDVLARGIDVSDVDHVINYDVPMDPEDYIHRIGRTGRAGEEGFSITFVSRDEEFDLYDIEYLMKKTVGEMDLPEFGFDDKRPELDPDRDPTQRPRRGGKGRGRGRGGRGGGRGGYRGERFERGERGYGDRGGRGGYRGGRDRHADDGNFDRTERQERRGEQMAQSDAVLSGEAPKPRSEQGEGMPDRDERRAARIAERDRKDAERREQERNERRENGYGERRSGGYRGGRDDRGYGRGGYGDRDRGGYRGDRGGYRRDDRDDRGGYRGGRDDRGYGRGGYGDRDRGGYRRDDRDDRGYGRDDRGGYRSGRDDRGYGRGGDRGYSRDNGGERRDGHRSEGGYSRSENRGYGDRGADRGYSRGNGSTPKQYGMQHSHKPGDRGAN